MKILVKKRNWQIYKTNAELQKKLAAELKISPAIAQILINRGVKSLTDANNFLNKDIKQLHDPFLLKDMGKAVSRIQRAISQQEKITIYGDYDTDGICATSLLYLVIQELGGDCNYYLPNRLEEGYGLNKDALDKCRSYRTNLLITVDCGISSVVEVAHANSLGMEIIITDHHQPTGELPAALALLDPKRTDCTYPYKHLAGVGVVYKLAQALTSKTKSFNLAKHLDLVALGTIADIVPISGENRILTHHGLETLKKTKKKGLQKLKKLVGLEDEDDLQTGHVAFRLAPRLNSSGRLDTAENSIRILLTTDTKEAAELAQILNKNNWERQKLEQQVLEEAIEQVETKFNFNSDKVIVIAKENWPVGIIGIVASRLVTRYHRPAIVISLENSLGRGSARSIKTFNLLEALRSCQDHFRKFGGHAYAAGIEIEEILINPLSEKINEYANNIMTNDDLVPQIEIDTNLDVNEITYDFLEQLEQLAPFGYHNPKPVFISTDLELYRDPIIVGKNHLKLWAKAGGRTFEAIGFDMGERIEEFLENHKITLVYRPQINTWQNRQTIQLHLEDLKLD